MDLKELDKRTMEIMLLLKDEKLTLGDKRFIISRLVLAYGIDI